MGPNTKTPIDPNRQTMTQNMPRPGPPNSYVAPTCMTQIC